MRKKIFASALLLVCATLLARDVIFIGANAQTTATDLKSQIEAKQRELDAVNEQLKAANANLSSTKQERLTLQAEINQLNKNIRTLNLGIQADTIASQKLHLQIQALSSDIQDISSSISLKQSAIETIISNIQKNEAAKQNLLMVFLRNASLADSVLEANNLLNLEAQLSTDISGLRELHDQYDANIKQSSARAAEVKAKQRDLEAKVAIVQDQNAQKQTLLATTKNKEGLFQQQLTTLQKQQQQIAGEIESLDAILRTKVDPSTLPPLKPGILLVPIADRDQDNLTQGYGSTSFAKNGYAGKWHNGLDFAAPIGTPILAAEDGVVAAVANEDLYCRKGAYGKFIAINHTNGLTTLYSHLSRWIVSNGQGVKRGQVIGYSGQSGYATGPHLHFTVFAQSTFYIKQSPLCGPLPVGGDLNPYGYLF